MLKGYQTNPSSRDEINRTSSKTQAALLGGDEEKKVTADGATRVLPDPLLIVLATENPLVLQELRCFQIVDRFMVAEHRYPDVESQAEILADRHTENPVDKVEQVSDEELKRK